MRRTAQRDTAEIGQCDLSAFMVKSDRGALRNSITHQVEPDGMDAVIGTLHTPTEVTSGA